MTQSEGLKINKTVLPNGLRFVHHYMPDSAMVALNVLYGVGSRNETADLTGIAHLFEHIMFGGSENVPDFDGILTSAGGISNAWTGNDFTDFYEIAPAHNAETLFYLESDRMLHPSISETTLEVQRSVVIEEFKQQCLNVPYGDMMHTLRSMLYGEHPYSWPVIGKDFKGLEKVTRSDMLRWWEAHYTPDNAVLSVAGNIDFDTALKYAVKWFGDIPARKKAPASFMPVADLVSEQTQIVKGPVPASMIVIAYLMGSYGTEEYVVADAITDVLSAGNASRFYQKITMNPNAPIVNADASITGSEDRGMLMLTARLADETINIKEAKDYLLNAAKSLFLEPVTERELQRLKNRQKSMFLLSNASCLGCAQTIAEAEIHGEKPEDRVKKYEKLTTESIISLARKIFENSYPAILYYRPL